MCDTFKHAGLIRMKVTAVVRFEAKLGFKDLLPGDRDIDFDFFEFRVFFRVCTFILRLGFHLREFKTKAVVSRRV